MACSKCNSIRIASVNAKCSDLCNVEIVVDKNTIADHDGYVPDDIGCGGGSYVELEYCLDCGQMQGTWPKPKTEMEEEAERWKCKNEDNV